MGGRLNFNKGIKSDFVRSTQGSALLIIYWVAVSPYVFLTPRQKGCTAKNKREGGNQLLKTIY